MTDTTQHPQRRASRRPRVGLWLSTVAVAVSVAALLAASALAGGAPVHVNATMNSTLGKQVAVTAQGRTLYTLSGESATHLKCKSSECVKFWPPLTVPSRTTKLLAGTGVHGKLAILRRSNGTLQVTLRGLPLYRFAGDKASGQANGEGVESFGGTWHAAAAGTSSPSTPSAPATPSTPSNPPYGY